MSRPGSDDGWSTPSYRGTAGRVGQAEDQQPRSGRTVNGRARTAAERPVERPVEDPRTSTRAFSGPPVGGPPAGVRRDAPRAPGDWSPAGPVSARDQRATRQAERRAAQDRLRAQQAVEKLSRQAAPKPYERGLQWWAALLVLIAVTVVGAVVDSITSSNNQDAFNVAIVVGSVAGILLVKRSNMFPIVIAPPIVYSLTALVQLYLRSSLSNDHRGAISTILDAVQNYLVYGFPALAIATAAVLLIGGIRLVTHK